MIVLPSHAPPAKRWLAHLVRAAAGVIRAGDRFDDSFAFEAEAVAELAHREGVAPLLHRGLVQGRIADPLPQPFRKSVRGAWEVSRRRSVAFREIGAAVGAELDAARVDAVPVGALALVRGKDELYLEPGLRPVEQLDLVVPRADAPRALRVLRQLGFGEGTESRMRPGVGFVRLARRTGEGMLPLTLHHALDGGRVARLDAERFVSAHVLRAADGRAEVAPGGHLLFVATRLAHAGLRPWIEILDLHRLVEARPAWPALVREAGATGLRRPLYVALAASRELLRSPVPKEVLAELAPGLLRRSLLHRRLAAGAREAGPATARSWLPDRAGSRGASAPRRIRSAPSWPTEEL